MPSTTAGRTVPCDWAVLAEHASDGLAVLDEDGLFLQVDAAGLDLCGRQPEDLMGMPAPFEPRSSDGEGDASDERVCVWAPVAGIRREFAYRTRWLPGEPRRVVVDFRDVTAERHHQRRIGAIARSSAKLASEGSISATLDALAREVLQADALAGMQILTADDAGNGLQFMGSAGFRRWPDFFDRLMECRERGAALRMIDAFEGLEPVSSRVGGPRSATIRHGPAARLSRELDWSRSPACRC